MTYKWNGESTTGNKQYTGPVNKTGQLSKVNKLSGYKEKWGIDVEPTNELIY